MFAEGRRYACRILAFGGLRGGEKVEVSRESVQGVAKAGGIASVMWIGADTRAVVCA